MRPVDLTPPEQRAGSRPPTRTGPLPYMLVTLLVLLLLGVVAVVFTNNEMAEAEADKQNLEYELQKLTVQANQLAPYVDFSTVASTRSETVRALALSRFDWHRVMQELSLVLPADVWLVNLTATVGPGVSLPNAAQVGNRAEVDSPAIQMIGCGSSQTKVAEFLAALEDIDGVTRVGLVSSQRRAPGAGGGGSDGNDCRTRGYIWQFEVLAVFDSVPAPAGSDVPVEPVTPPPVDSEQPVDGSEESNGSDSGSGDSGDGSGNGNGNGNGGSGNGNGGNGSGSGNGGNGSGNGSGNGNGGGNGA